MKKIAIYGKGGIGMSTITNSISASLSIKEGENNIKIVVPLRKGGLKNQLH